MQIKFVMEESVCFFPDDCNGNVFLWSGGTKIITHQYTQTDKECYYQIMNLETSEEFRLTFTQSDGNPIHYANKSSTKCTDTENFIRISNHLDIHGQDKDISFLFCGDEYPPPYVSILQTAHVVVKHDHELLVVFKIEDLSKGIRADHVYHEGILLVVPLYKYKC